MNLESIQHILTAQMISSVQEGELCRSLRYLAESTELTEAEVNNLPDEARSFVLAAIPNEASIEKVNSVDTCVKLTKR